MQVSLPPRLFLILNRSLLHFPFYWNYKCHGLAKNQAAVGCTYPTLTHKRDLIQDKFFKLNIAGLKSEFSFSWTGCLTKIKERELPYYLTIAEQLEKNR